MHFLNHIAQPLQINRGWSISYLSIKTKASSTLRSKSKKDSNYITIAWGTESLHVSQTPQLDGIPQPVHPGCHVYERARQLNEQRESKPKRKANYLARQAADERAADEDAPALHDGDKRGRILHPATWRRLPIIGMSWHWQHGPGLRPAFVTSCVRSVACARVCVRPWLLIVYCAPLSSTAKVQRGELWLSIVNAVTLNYGHK